MRVGRNSNSGLDSLGSIKKWEEILMRLRTNKLSGQDIRDALTAAKDEGEVSLSVFFDELDERKAQRFARGFEIHLISFEGGRDPRGKARRKCSNSRDSDRASDYAATYDEWGWFISHLFDADPEMEFGPYKGASKFHELTRYRY